MNFVIKFLVAFAIFMVVDLIWLGVIAKELYKRELGYIMTDNVKWIAAIIFYIIYIVGVVFFVVNPAIEKQSIIYAIFAGAFLGFFAYATYDLTNHATLKDWPLKITIIDLLWGSSVTTIVSTLTYLIFK